MQNVTEKMLATHPVNDLRATRVTVAILNQLLEMTKLNKGAKTALK